MPLIGRLTFVKTSILPKFIYRFNAITKKISENIETQINRTELIFQK